MMQRAEAPSALPPASRVLASVGIVLTSLLLLLLALAASGLLAFSMLQRAQGEILAERFELLGREGAGQIEAGLRFGRPLEQFLGLPDILSAMETEAPEIALLTVTDAAGVAVGGESGPETIALQSALATLLSERTATSASLNTLNLSDTRFFLTPLQTRDGALAGILVIGVPIGVLGERLDSSIQASITFMLIVTAGAALLLAVTAGRLRGAMTRSRGARWRWLATPLIVLLGAQLAYSFDVLKIVSTSYIDATQSAAHRIGERVEEDLNRLLALGLSLDRMSALDSRLQTILQISTTVARIEIVDTDGTVRYFAEQGNGNDAGLLRHVPIQDPAPIAFPLTGTDGAAVGEIRVIQDRTTIAATLVGQALNVMTVAVTSSFFMIEMLILLQILMQRAHRTAPADAPAGSGPAPTGAAARLAAKVGAPVADDPTPLIARPVMFAFVLCWALPLSFLPLKMRSLGVDLFDLPRDVVLALPISAEMGCALVTSIVAGRLSDRFGWHLPFFVGLLISAGAGIAAAFAPDSISFVIARGLTGLGYGLSWMGLQSFVIQNCPAERRGRALANLMAGILAGFITGSALGGILSEQVGYDAVLLTSGIMVLFPLVIGVVLLRGFVRRIPPRPAAPVHATGTQPQAGSGFSSWMRLLRSPEYLGALLLSIVPFSIAQVGLLYFAVPLHLDKIGASISDAGRVLMIYGVVVIIFGPALSGFVDRSPHKSRFIAFGGLIGGLGLTVLFLDIGLWSLFLATALLALSSSLIEPARVAFILKLKEVQDLGPSSVLGLQRAADKFGQMVGPMVIALHFGPIDIVERVGVVGVGFALASVLFGLIALSRNSDRRGHPFGATTALRAGNEP